MTPSSKNKKQKRIWELPATRKLVYQCDVCAIYKPDADSMKAHLSLRHGVSLA